MNTRRALAPRPRTLSLSHALLSCFSAEEKSVSGRSLGEIWGDVQSSAKIKATRGKTRSRATRPCEAKLRKCQITEAIHFNFARTFSFLFLLACHAKGNFFQ